MASALIAAFLLGVPDVRSERFEIITSDGRAQSIHALVAVPESPRGTVLLVHGSAFSAQTWHSLGTLSLLADSGFRAIAVDVPGYGSHLSGRERLRPTEAAEFLAQFLDVALPHRGERVVCVAASMGGTYANPLVSRHPERVAGYVPIAAVTTTELGAPHMPALILWGELDSPNSAKARLYTSRFPKHHKVVFPDAPHPCYLKSPKLFNALLLEFVGAKPQERLRVRASWR
ncbi:hypothetical protein KFE25_008405 [Diacronema lutheri]|uniref:AB hydrolase-1 domain-containing protein n=1 Tax=Diacronema lutheri TaxID=2081491 RepID=A0A8J5X8J4_DIALT|nr:hypothetical protein KFE25_008405 [Diacronema lutheri]